MTKALPKVAERFIKYAKYDTQSAYDSESYPSTSKQLVLLKDLVEELKEIGLEDVHIDEYGYVFGTLPANIEGDIPKIGFLAHVDTTPEMTGKNVNPQVVKNYDGGDIILNKEENIILSLNNHRIKKLYWSNSNYYRWYNFVGADDKAGVAEIVTTIEYLVEHPEIPHGTVKVAFTPDEEVGRGVIHFDLRNLMLISHIHWMEDLRNNLI